MNIKTLFVSLLLGMPMAMMAQTAITPEVLSQIEKAQTETSADKAIRNALARNSVASLAADISGLSQIDSDFSDVVPTKGITNQKSSGRCWLFTGLNVLRSKAIEKYDLPGLELSQNYLFFYDQLEKANLFLQGVIDTSDKPMDDRTVSFFFSSPLSDGGTFCGVADLVAKYGVVPREAMAETYSSENTSQFLRPVSQKLREMGLELRDLAAAKKSMKQIEARKVEMLATVYHMLSLGLGVPPTEFTWSQRGKDGKIVSTDKYTPKSYYEKYWGGEDLNSTYVLFMNDPMREYYKVYQIQYDRHTYDGHDWVYLNLPSEEVKPLLISSIKDKSAMYISCDVGKFLDRKKGTLDLKNFDYGSLYGVEFGMDKKQRVLSHDSGSSHAMTMIAVDIDPATGKTKKWMVENSWGAESGYHGKLIMTDEWFDNYMFRFVIDKKYVPAKYQELFKQKPIMLPAWDPMFSMDE